MMMERYFRIVSCFLGRAGFYVLLVALPGSLLAAQWTVSPSVKIGQSYNDNIYLSNLTSPIVTTRTINPVIDFGWATKIANISLLGDWKYRQYSGDLKLKNRTDSRYQLKSEYKTEHSEFFLDGSSVKNTTLSQDRYSEDTGVTLAQLDRQTMQIAPAWSWMVNERSNLRINLQYQDVVYEKRSISPYNDYRYDRGSLTYTFQWTMRDQMYAVVEQSRYDSRKRALIPAYEMVSPSKYLGSNSATMTYQIGLNHQFSSTFKVGLGYGLRDSETQTQYQNCTQINFYTLTCVATNETQTSSTTTSPVYTVSADKDFELTKLGIKLSRTLSASGLGSEMQVDSLDMTINHHISEKFNLRFKGIVNQRLAVNPGFNSYDRKYLRGEASLGWKPDKTWNVYLAYRYVRQIYKRSDAIAVSNNISLNVRYAWDRISVSR